MFQLNLVTPEKKLVTDLEVEEVIVPGFKGQLDILPGHAPLMTTLGTGVLKYRAKGSSSFEVTAVSWGYCHVSPTGVTILAETAESVAEINREKAEAQLKTANQKLLEPILEPDQISHLHHQVEQAQARLEALGISPGSQATH